MGRMLEIVDPARKVGSVWSTSRRTEIRKMDQTRRKKKKKRRRKKKQGMDESSTVLDVAVNKTRLE